MDGQKLLLSRTVLKEFLSLAAKESYFIFKRKFYRQVDEVAIGSCSGLTLANAFLIYFEKKWLQNFPPHYKPHYYRRYVDIFV